MIPGFTINRICWASGLLLNRFASGAISVGTQKVLVTTLGLASVPVIIKPIDRYVSVIYVLNNYSHLRENYLIHCSTGLTDPVIARKKKIIIWIL